MTSGGGVSYERDPKHVDILARKMWQPTAMPLPSLIIDASIGRAFAALKSSFRDGDAKPAATSISLGGQSEASTVRSSSCRRRKQSIGDL